MSIIFLDIDGVLNDHTKLPSGYCGIQLPQAQRFNRILAAVPEAKIVISSAWRYLILRGDMTIKGFELMLLIHGVLCYGRILGHTAADGEICDEPDHHDRESWERIGLQMRAGQIARAVEELRPSRYVVLDDLPLDVPNLVRTDGGTGLTEADAARAIQLFTPEAASADER